MEKTGILAVSFGTTNLESIKNNIEACEKAVKTHFLDYEVKRAFSSKIVKRRLSEKYNFSVDNVSEALGKMKNENFQVVIIQPLHIIPGKEFHEILETISIFKKYFNKIITGRPLLGSIKDYDLVADALTAYLKIPDRNEAILLMGHGSKHPANACYSSMQLKLNDRNLNIFIATVEGYPGIKDILPVLKSKKISNIKLMPFMIVAGEHAANDMSGDKKESWKNILYDNGYNVEIIVKGLGEIKDFQDIFINHMHDAINKIFKGAAS